MPSYSTIDVTAVLRLALHECYPTLTTGLLEFTAVLNQFTKTQNLIWKDPQVPLK